MELIVERYCKWWARKCEGLSKFPGRTLRDRIVGLPDPFMRVDAAEHASIIREAVADFKKERPSLLWVPKLEAELLDWERAFKSSTSIQGLSIEEAVDSVMQGDDIEQIIGHISHG